MIANWEEKIKERLKHAEPLYCDMCGKQIGWVYEFDLEGNYFACDDCITKVKVETR